MKRFSEWNKWVRIAFIFSLIFIFVMIVVSFSCVSKFRTLAQLGTSKGFCADLGERFNNTRYENRTCYIETDKEYCYRVVSFVVCSELEADLGEKMLTWLATWYWPKRVYLE